MRDPVLREAFGRVRDGDYIDYYAQVKRRNTSIGNSVVTNWEIQRYLTLF